ncbi:MAG TPA: peroxiredoxin [Geobacteraceae bacterium]|nr:peroxiredoxin [Geobacteraceae bacterium]
MAALLLWGCLEPGPAAADTLTGKTETYNQRDVERTTRTVGARVGEPAPTFTLDAVVGTDFKKISLADYRGRWVVLFFYPLDFTFVCPTEIKGFNETLKEFEKLNAVVLGASVDSKWSHKAWIERGDLGDLKYPLLSDFKKETARGYGILNENEGVALRGLFIIDDKGILQYESVNNLSVGRNVAEVLRVLEALQTGELCPINWKRGQKTLGK